VPEATPNPDSPVDVRGNVGGDVDSNVDVDVTPKGFEALGLDALLVATLRELEYRTPTPIQVQSIPALLAGRDLIGQAQTGTGKTAAFALPLLQRINPKKRKIQGLILTPTRELALQVAEAVKTYSAKLGHVRIAAVYGGQAILPQIRLVERGAQIVVGTPGRIMDLMRRGTIKLGELDLLVLDEADEMLRMGFIDDVEWILGHTPDRRQIALFSATMPSEIERIAQRYTTDSVRISVARKALTLPNISQSYWYVKGLHKLDALTRILETETINAGIIFVKTKVSCIELAQKLAARGFSVEALNGDLTQAAREQAIRRMKAGKIDLIVATDVAARGLDIDRISHVFNFDIPMDVESYVHRIGRTGRAGNAGKAILFVSPKERWMLNKIERFIKAPIPPLKLPNYAMVIEKRARILKERLYATIEGSDLTAYHAVALEMLKDGRFDLPTIAAAAIRLAQGDQSLEMKAKAPAAVKSASADEHAPERPRKPRKVFKKPHKKGGFKKKGKYKKASSRKGPGSRSQSRRASA